MFNGSSVLIDPIPNPRDQDGEQSTLLVDGRNSSAGLSNSIHLTSHNGSSASLTPMAISGQYPAHIVSKCQKICYLLGNYEEALQFGNFQNAVTLFTQIFGSLLLVANFSLAAQFTDAQPNKVAGLMSIQTFTFEALKFMIHRLRKHKQPLAGYVYDAFTKSVAMAAVVEVYYQGDAMFQNIPDLEDFNSVATLATFVAAGCVLTEQAANVIFAKARKRVLRLIEKWQGHVGYEFRANFGAAEEVKPPKWICEKIRDEGNYGLNFLFFIIWIFCVTHHQGIATWVKQDEATVPIHNEQDFQFAMQAASFNVGLSQLMAMLQYLWLWLIK